MDGLKKIYLAFIPLAVLMIVLNFSFLGFAAKTALAQDSPQAAAVDLASLDCSVCDKRCLYPPNTKLGDDSTKCGCTLKQKLQGPINAAQSGCLDPENPKCHSCPELPPNPWYFAGACTPQVEAECSKGLLPFCARTKLGCVRIEDFILFLIKYGKFAFGIAGSLALLMIVYGGVMMLTSFGNSEQLARGKSALTASVIGLIIIFAAYFIIGLIVQSLGVLDTDTFNLNGGVFSPF